MSSDSKISLDPELERRFLVLGELGRTAAGHTLQIRERGGSGTKVLEIRRAKVTAEKLERAQALLDLHHPGLVRVEEIGRTEAGIYWLREDTGEVTLESLMAAERIELPTALDVLDQALEALQVLHGAGFWVRNLSPSDLAMRAGGRIALLDLGLGHGLATDEVPSATAVFVGRLRYASPEQFEDEASVGPPSDLYAVGLIAFEMLTGRFPIAGETPSSLIAGHLFRPPLAFEQADPESRVPELVRAWVLARLAKNPVERGDLTGVRRALSGLRAAAGPADYSRFKGLFERSSTTAADSALGAVEKALEGGDLASARRLLEKLRASGPAPGIEEMARRLAAVEGFTHAADVHRLVSEAQQRLDAGAPSSAVGCLEEASRLVPDDAEVARLLEVAKRTALRSAQGRPEGPTAMLGEVQAMIDEEGARRARQAEEEQASRGARIDSLLKDARASAEGEDFASARGAIEKILHLAEDHPEALALRASIDAIQRIRHEEAAENEALERTAGDIRKLLDGGEAEKAQESLERATERFGDAEVLDTVRFDVTRARLDSEVSRTVQLSPEELQAAIAAETASVSDGATQHIPASVLAEAVAAETATTGPNSEEPAAVERGNEELPSTVTLAPDMLAKAKERALAAAAKGDIRLGTGGSVTLPMETIEAAKRRAMELRAKEGGEPGASPPAIVTPGPGSVTLPMQAVEEAKKRALAHQAGQAPKPVPSASRMPPPPPPLPSTSTRTMASSALASSNPAGSSPASPSPAPPTTAPQRPASQPPAPHRPAPSSPRPTATATPSGSPRSNPTPPQPAVQAPAAPSMSHQQGAAGATFREPPSTGPASTGPASTGPSVGATPGGSASPSAPAEFKLDDLGFGGPETATPARTASRSTSASSASAQRRAAPPGRGPIRPVAALGVLVVLALIFAASYFSGRLQSDGENPPPPAEDVTATDLPAGTLLLDAAPWAVIDKITDSSGEEVTLVGARYTPKRLELAPGVYTLALSYPSSGESKQATFEVESRGEHRVHVSFDVDVEEFFRHADW